MSDRTDLCEMFDVGTVFVEIFFCAVAKHSWRPWAVVYSESFELEFLGAFIKEVHRRSSIGEVGP